MDKKVEKLLNDFNISKYNLIFKKLKDYIYKTKKSTGYLYIFTYILIIENNSIFYVKELFDDFIDKKDLFKNRYKQPLEKVLSFKYEKTISEQLTDILIILSNDRLKNEIYSLLPSHLKKEVINYQKFENIIQSINNNEQKDLANNFIKKKSSRYKDGLKFLDDLESQIDYLKKDDIVEKINNHPYAVLIYDKDNTVIACIDSFEASKNLGSKNWCISTDESHWKSYIKGGYNLQYFIWDFNLPVTNKNYLIGLTRDYYGKIITAHYADDSNLTNYDKKELKDNFPFITWNVKPIGL